MPPRFSNVRHVFQRCVVVCCMGVWVHVYRSPTQPWVCEIDPSARILFVFRWSQQVCLVVAVATDHARRGGKKIYRHAHTPLSSLKTLTIEGRLFTSNCIARPKALVYSRKTETERVFPFDQSSLPSPQSIPQTSKRPKAR